VQLASAVESTSEGNLEDAKERYDKMEKDQEMSAGPIDYNTVLAVHELAATLKMLGRLEESQALYRRAFTSYKILLGQNDPLTLEVAEELALIMQLRGSFSGAVTIYETCIDVKTATLGKDHPSTASSIAKFATLLDLQFDFPKADKKYLTALEIMHTSLSECHPLTVSIMEDHALSYRMRSWYEADSVKKEKALEDSIRLYKEALQIKVKSRPWYSEEQIEWSRSNLAEMMAERTQETRENKSA
jgi:tetratricopeptide (TPR) repeat protein